MVPSGLLPWIVLLPALAAILIALFTPYLRRFSAFLSIGAITGSLLLTLLLFAQKLQDPEGIFYFRYPFLNINGRLYELGLQMDNLALLMTFLVTFVGTLIHIYSVGYMAHDEGFPRFFGFLSIFTASMLLLVLADNFLFLFIGWEMVGFASYSLIGFYYRKPSASRAGKKAFLTTRTGDLGLLLGWALLFGLSGELSFRGVEEWARTADPGLLTVIALLIFWGAVGKSAQIPLQVWLPDAMEGPTPVSALIHAATMVAAGVYLVTRTFFLFEHSSLALQVVAVVGALTAFLAATIGMAMMDIKRVLAYSTISQLGYMMAGLGVGSPVAGFFHLLTHGFFKALLFLGSGSVIHACHTNDMRRMGGLRRYMPITFWTFLIGTLALVGIPPLAGYFSKDAILLAAWSKATKTGFWAPFVLLLGGVFFTSFYMFRLLYLTFFGEYRGSRKHHPHESPPVMTIPLIVLAICSVVAGFFGKFIAEMLGSEKAHGGMLVPVLSVVLALFGWLLAHLTYGTRTIDPYLLQRRARWLVELLVRKYYFDEAYQALIVRPGMALAGLLARFDKWIIDGLVNLVGYATVTVAFFVGFWDKFVVDGLVNLVAWTVGKIAEGVRRIQWGQVQVYAEIITIGIILILLVMHRTAALRLIGGGPP